MYISEVVDVAERNAGVGARYKPAGNPGLCDRATLPGFILTEGGENREPQTNIEHATCLGKRFHNDILGRGQGGRSGR